MKYSIEAGAYDEKNCLIIGVYEAGELTPTARSLNKLSGDYINDRLKQSECDGKLGQTLTLYQVPGVDAERIILVGCGPKKN